MYCYVVFQTVNANNNFYRYKYYAKFFCDCDVLETVIKKMSNGWASYLVLY